jgi:hypothetical protein
MNKGGVFVFDVNTVYKHETILGDNIFIKETDGIHCTWQNIYRGNGMVDITLDIFEKRSDCAYERTGIYISERAYDLDIIHRICEQSGFKISDCRDFLSDSKIKENSEKAVFVCIKI